jgi:hypothetical protein
MLASQQKHNTAMIRGAEPEQTAGNEIGFVRADGREPRAMIIVIVDDMAGDSEAFSNPQAALQWPKEKEVSPIIAAPKTPGMVGAELARRVQFQKVLAQSQSIRLTAGDDRLHRAVGDEAGGPTNV